MGNNQKKQLNKKDIRRIQENVEEIKESYKLGIKYYENVEEKNKT